MLETGPKVSNNEKENPKVDILLATYNGEKYLDEQLNSIVNQTFQNWRIIASDDGSSDSTRWLLNEYARKDARIKVLPAAVPHGSACANFMSLIEHSTSRYFMFCDQDDVWLQDKIEKSLEAINSIEQTAMAETPLLVYSDTIVVDESLRELDKSYLSYSGKKSIDSSVNQLLMTNVVPGCTLLGNSALRNLAIRCEASSAGNKILMHDWWLALVAVSCGKLYKMPDSGVLYRQHDSNVVGAEKETVFSVLSRVGRSAEMFWKCVDQAEYLLQCYEHDMSGESRKVVQSFVSLKYQPKYLRARFAIKNKLVKKNIVKALGEIIVLTTTSRKSG